MTRRVAYFTDIQHRQDVNGTFSIKETRTDTGSFSFSRADDSRSSDKKSCSDDHLMDPQRLRMVHSLVLSLGLRDLFRLVPTEACSYSDLRTFHSPEYLKFLQTVTHEKIVTGEVSSESCHAFNIGPVKDGVDCTAFAGLWDFNRLVAGASLDAAYMLRTGETDIAINWAGGLHHAKSGNAAGFCYVNDCVVAIVELLRTFDRVLYVDIDFHHGDGVEEAFYITDRVCTFSMHRFSPKKVFPGTGDLHDTGAGLGKFHAVNVPLLGGVTDEVYVPLFTELVTELVDVFKPSAIVLQAGADSLVGDSVGMENGCFNLSTRGHAECVRVVRDFNLPLLVLGGGGYSKTAVARCWAIETAILCGRDLTDLPDTVPTKDFYHSEYHEKSMHVESRKGGVDFNSPGRMDMIRDVILENIERMTIFQRNPNNVPPDARGSSRSKSS